MVPQSMYSETEAGGVKKNLLITEIKGKCTSCTYPFLQGSNIEISKQGKEKEA